MIDPVNYDLANHLTDLHEREARDAFIETETEHQYNELLNSNQGIDSVLEYLYEGDTAEFLTALRNMMATATVEPDAFFQYANDLITTFDVAAGELAELNARKELDSTERTGAW